MKRLTNLKKIFIQQNFSTKKKFRKADRIEKNFLSQFKETKPKFDLGEIDSNETAKENYINSEFSMDDELFGELFGIEEDGEKGDKKKVMKNVNKQIDFFNKLDGMSDFEKMIDNKKVNKIVNSYKQSVEEKEEENQNIISISISNEKYKNFNREEFEEKWNQKGYEIVQIVEPGYLQSNYIIQLKTLKKENVKVKKSNEKVKVESQQETKEKKLRELTLKLQEMIKKNPKRSKKILNQLNLASSKKEKNDITIEPVEIKQEIEEIDEEINETREYHKFKMNSGNTRIPKALEEKINEMIKNYPKALLRDSSKHLSATFRVRTGGYGNQFNFKNVNNEIGNSKQQDQMNLIDTLKSGNEPTEIKRNMMKYSETDVVAYIAHRIPGIYGTITRIFNEIKKKMPNYKPYSMLDFGTGPGTSIYAMNQIFPDCKEVMAVEPSNEMMDVGMKILEDLDINISWRRFLNENMNRKFDFMTASYVLNEIQQSTDRVRIIQSLWKLSNGILIFIEPEARSVLLNQFNDVSILGPCTHEGQCPMKSNSWCHFSQRSDRLNFQKITKQGITKSYEDEKFSYVVFIKKDLMKNEIDDAYKKNNSRIMTPPKLRGGHSIMDFCTSDGSFVEKKVIKKSDGSDKYKMSRKLFWGDIFPYKL